jgi:hypothetical protein
MNIQMASFAQRRMIGQSDFGQMVSNAMSTQQSIAANQQAQVQQAATGMISAANTTFAAAQAAADAAEAEKNRTYIILGGIALVGAMASYLLLNKK